MKKNLGNMFLAGVLASAPVKAENDGMKALLNLNGVNTKERVTEIIKPKNDVLNSPMISRQNNKTNLNGKNFEEYGFKEDGVYEVQGTGETLYSSVTGMKNRIAKSHRGTVIYENIQNLPRAISLLAKAHPEITDLQPGDKVIVELGDTSQVDFSIIDGSGNQKFNTLIQLVNIKK